MSNAIGVLKKQVAIQNLLKEGRGQLTVDDTQWLVVCIVEPTVGMEQSLRCVKLLDTSLRLQAIPGEWQRGGDLLMCFKKVLQEIKLLRLDWERELTDPATELEERHLIRSRVHVVQLFLLMLLRLCLGSPEAVFSESKGNPHNSSPSCNCFKCFLSTPLRRNQSIRQWSSTLSDLLKADTVPLCFKLAMISLIGTSDELTWLHTVLHDLCYDAMDFCEVDSPFSATLNELLGMFYTAVRSTNNSDIVHNSSEIVNSSTFKRQTKLSQDMLLRSSSTVFGLSIFSDSNVHSTAGTILNTALPDKMAKGTAQSSENSFASFTSFTSDLPNDLPGDSMSDLTHIAGPDHFRNNEMKDFPVLSGVDLGISVVIDTTECTHLEPNLDDVLDNLLPTESPNQTCSIPRPPTSYSPHSHQSRPKRHSFNFSHSDLLPKPPTQLTRCASEPSSSKLQHPHKPFKAARVSINSSPRHSFTVEEDKRDEAAFSFEPESTLICSEPPYTVQMFNECQTINQLHCGLKCHRKVL
mmetsp:Transcript_1424/g.2725  ORF Transcript_1424/g.2725 Transcript_1424/m.2725 type:complete len:523 (+) Transcript_1424:45-1613(+)